MGGFGIGALRVTLREFFFLDEAQQRSATSGVSRSGAVRAYEEAARRRRSLARAFRDPAERGVALSLYRSAVLLHIAAYLVSQDRALEIERLTPEEVLERLGRAVEGRAGEIEALRSVVTLSDPYGVERLPAREARAAARRLESVTGWLSTLVEVRSPAQLRWIGRIRLAGAGLAAALMMTWVARWALFPDVALNKPVRSSSTAFDSKPSAAVDGKTNGQYGFHSQKEDHPWLSIDLQRPYRLTAVKVMGRGDGWYDQSIPLALEVSDDDKTYREVARRTIPFSEDAPWNVALDGVKARFVRLRADHDGYLVLGEVGVYGR